MRVVKTITLLAIVGAGFSIFFTARKGVESDLFALIPDSGGVEMRSAVAMTANLARFLVKADSEEAARARLVELGAIKSQASSHEPQLATILKALAPYARSFLSPTMRQQLERGEFTAVRDAAAARLFSPMPPVLPPTQDPFLLFTDYVLDLSAPKGEWVAVNAMLTPDAALTALAAVRGADDVRCAGAPFHTAVASERSKREINILSGISLVCVILFGWLLTRSFRFLGMLMVLLTAAFCMASAALFAFFPKPHLMTFVFGTTLIGLSVDYVYHALTARSSITKPLTFSFLSTAACFLPLLLSSVGVLNQMAVFTVVGLTTVYAGVMIFGGDGNRTQSAEGEWRAKCATGGRGRFFFCLAVFVLFALCIVGIVRVRVDNDLSRFHRPDPDLAEGERIAVAMSGGEGFVPSVKTQLHNAELVRRLYITEGKKYCEMTGLPSSVLKLPSVDRAFDPKGELEGVFARLTRKLRAVLLLTCGATVCLLGVILLLLCYSSLRRRIGDATVAQSGVSGVATCFLSAVLSAFATIGFLGWMGEPITFFNLLCVFIFFGLGLDYSIFSWHSRHQQSFGLHSLSLTPSSEREGACQKRSDTLSLEGAGVPSLEGAGVPSLEGAGVPSLEGGAVPSLEGGAVPPLEGGGARQRMADTLSLTAMGRAVRYSFLTSFVGFGLLAFTDFAVTRSMGITLAIGLVFSYLAAKVFCVAGSNRVGEAVVPSSVDGGGEPLSSGCGGTGPENSVVSWHEQREQCASLFWAQFMWYSYAWFGKTFQKIIFVVGMPFIYLFAKPPRLALGKFYGVLSEFTGRPYPATHGRLFRHLLGFAWGLMDKTDASTLKKNLPAMTVRDDAGWRAFKEIVDARKGAFIFCTHVGVIGVLPALPKVLDMTWTRKVHAFQQMGHDAVFMKVFMKHFDSSKIEMHAVEEIGVETAVAMQEAIGRGELVIMAGDRTSAGSKSVLHHRFLGRDCVWPKGAFRFAALMESPMFAVTCIRTGWNRYEVHMAEVGGTSSLEDYVKFLEAETLAHPEQWYQFYDFFGERND